MFNFDKCFSELNEAVYPDEINNKNKVEVWRKSIKIGSEEVLFLAAYQVWSDTEYTASIILQTGKASDVLFEKTFKSKEEAVKVLNKFKF